MLCVYMRIYTQVWHGAKTGPRRMSTLLLTWKDVVSNQEAFRRPRWWAPVAFLLYIYI